MNKDQVKGRVDEAVGKVKQAVADLTDDGTGHAKGTAQEVKGKVQKTYGDTKAKVADAIDR